MYKKGKDTNENIEYVFIHKTPFLLGRQNADFLDPSKHVSRRHFQIHFSENEYKIEDLKSTNKVRINEMLINPNELVPLKSGDVIRIADSQYEFVLADE